jgi:hypothetical protein
MLSRIERDFYQESVVAGRALECANIAEDGPEGSRCARHRPIAVRTFWCGHGDRGELTGVLVRFPIENVESRAKFQIPIKKISWRWTVNARR